MTYQILLRIAFSLLPFGVCMHWFICFALKYNKTDEPNRIYTTFIGTCMVLYFCHALFFTVGIPSEIECLWTFCSLSVYPLFYMYICRLTSHEYDFKHHWQVLIPSIVVTILKFMFPESEIDIARMVVFSLQLIAVCHFGIKKMNAFDKEIKAIYADTDDKSTSNVHSMLIAIVITCFISALVNFLGKHFFGESIWLLMPISIAFSTMLYALSYVCYHRTFSADQLFTEHIQENETNGENTETKNDIIGRNIESLMTDAHVFLIKDLKIDELAIRINSNRTYVSKYINDTYKCSFSDYINKKRIEYAKSLLITDKREKLLSSIAELSGFSSEQSFFRNFKKFTNKTPREWLKSQGMS